MNIKKSLNCCCIAASLVCAVISIPKAEAQSADATRLNFLWNEALSHDITRSNNAMMELVEKQQFGLMHEIFWQLDPNLRQSAAGYLTISGEKNAVNSVQTNFRIDWLLLQYYKSTNVPIPSGDHESSNARNFGTHRCLKYLSQKYNVPFEDYEPHLITLRKVAEIIGRLEEFFYREFDKQTFAASDDGTPPDLNSTVKRKGESGPVPNTANSPSHKNISLLPNKNWWPALTAASILLNIVLIWLKVENRPRVP